MFTRVKLTLEQSAAQQKAAFEAKTKAAKERKDEVDRVVRGSAASAILEIVKDTMMNTLETTVYIPKDKLANLINPRIFFFIKKYKGHEVRGAISRFAEEIANAASHSGLNVHIIKETSFSPLEGFKVTWRELTRKDS